MKPLTLPPSYNYIGIFLTLRCNLGCDYCINRFDGDVAEYKELTGNEWVQGLSRIETREDLPISLQGGEPTVHKDFYSIVPSLYNKHLDLLTNGLFDINTFVTHIRPHAFRKCDKYASIRFSFHKHTSPAGLAMKVFELKKLGYPVGIWGLNHPEMYEKNKWMGNTCEWLNVDFRMKDYLDDTYMKYKYPEAVNGTYTKEVMCRPSELLIAPDGRIFRCHSHLYSGVCSIGNILDEELEIKDNFYNCDSYGLCNPCDLKVKNNRFQEWGHCAVEIKDVR